MMLHYRYNFYICIFVLEMRYVNNVLPTKTKKERRQQKIKV